MHYKANLSQNILLTIFFYNSKVARVHYIMVMQRMQLDRPKMWRRARIKINNKVQFKIFQLFNAIAENTLGITNEENKLKRKTLGRKQN